MTAGAAARKAARRPVRISAWASRPSWTGKTGSRRATSSTASSPDVFVTCAARDLRTEMVFEHPTPIVEVLSESTQALDRGARFAA